MTEGRTTAMALMGIAMLVYAAGIIVGMNPPMDGRRVSVVSLGDVAPWVGGLVLASAIHLWAALSETSLTKPIAHVVSLAGMAAGVVLIATLQPLGIVLLVIYGYILFGLVRRADEARSDGLRRHLHRGKASGKG